MAYIPPWLIILFVIGIAAAAEQGELEERVSSMRGEFDDDTLDEIENTIEDGDFDEAKKRLDGLDN